MDITTRTIGLAVAALALFMASPAEADVVYDWTVSLPLINGGALTGSGELVAASTISTSFDGKYTGFLVNSITGTYGGSTITGLAAVGTAYGNDNLINTSQALLDWDGISFYISPPITGETNPVNLFNRPDRGYTDVDPNTSYGTFTLTAVPEPGPWSALLLAAAFVLLKRNALKPGLLGYRLTAFILRR